MDRADAQAFCESIGAYLVAIESKKEQKFLAKILEKGRVTEALLWRRWWTGGKETEDEWVWERPDGSEYGL